MSLTISRDAHDQVLIAGWKEAEPPQILIRERRDGRFLTQAGWKNRSGMAPLTPSALQGTFVLNVDGRSLPPGTPVQLEVPASNLTQEVLWPAEIEVVADALAPKAPPLIAREPVGGPRPAHRPQAPPSRHAISLLVMATVALPCLAIGVVLGWFYQEYAYRDAERASAAVYADQQATVAMLTARVNKADAEAAARGQQAASLESARLDVARSQRQLEADQRLLKSARDQLEAEKVQLATERDRFELMRRGQPPVSGSPATLTGLPGQVPGSADAPGVAADVSATRAATECDTLAANPLDRNRTIGTLGASMPQLRANAAAAVDACLRASEVNPGQLNYAYQHARAVQSSSLNEAEPLLVALAQKGYPAAFDNLAMIYLVRDRNIPRGAAMLRQGVARGDPDAMVSLALLIKAGDVRPGPGENYRALLQEAASLGHPTALAAADHPGSAIGAFFEDFFGRRR